MVQLSHLISLPVFSVFEVRFEGTVENALLSLKTKKIKWLIIYNEETDERKILPFNKVFAISESGLTIKNSSVLSLYESLELEISGDFNPINSGIFNVNGEYLGNVNDVVLNNDKIESFVSKLLTIPVNNILAFNNKLTLLKQKEKQTLSSFKKSQLKTKITNFENSEQKVSILSTENENVNVVTPKKAVINYNFLINRKVTKDILANSGEIIVKKNSVISLNVIDVVKQFGKLKELTLYSK